MSLARITNRDFLRAIFGPAWGDALVTSFDGDPGKPPPGAWSTARAGRFVPDKADKNNYFCISTFHPGPNGAPRRRKDLHKFTFVIILDDMGEKLRADLARAKLGEPSYRLETSPGSEQWGYILELPEPNAARVDALLDGLVRADLNPAGVDPGMKGVTRLVRLPVGRNGKPKHGPGGAPCVLLEWAPERTFTVDELAEAIGLDLADVAPAARHTGRSVGAVGQDHILDLLHEIGWTKHALGEGKWEITCPFVDTHSDRANNGAAYLGDGCFKCHHRCEALASHSFRAALDVAARAAGLRTLGAREFTGADAAILARVREHLAGGPRLSTDEAGQAALVPRQDVQRVFREEHHGTSIAERRTLRRRITRLRRKAGQPVRPREPRKIDAPTRADNYQPPISLDEVRAAQRALIQAAMSAPAERRSA